jgi:hypothetical protein
MLRIFLACAVMLGVPAAACAADAGSEQQSAARRHHKAAPPEGEVYRHIYAEAWYGNRKVIAPVRRIGCCDEVQLPTGEWIACEFSCEITMRKMPLAYWQSLGAGYDKTGPDGEERPDHWTDSWGNKRGYLF